MKLLQKVLCLLLVAAFAAPSSAEAKHDEFYAVFVGETLYEGGGTGWNGGEWIWYPQTGWWNQWFYDGRPDPERWKKIDFRIRIEPALPDVGTDQRVALAINWSNLEFPQTGPDGRPPMADQEWAIERRVIFDELVSLPIEIRSEVPFVIEEYNPEWVSIDVMVDQAAGDELLIDGEIWHECVPEPATMGLLAIAGLVLIRRRRR